MLGEGKGAEDVEWKESERDEQKPCSPIRQSPEEGVPQRKQRPNVCQHIQKEKDQSIRREQPIETPDCDSRRLPQDRQVGILPEHDSPVERVSLEDKIKAVVAN